MTGYFDYAAATPVDPGVFDAMRPFFTDNFYNPSAMTRRAGSVKEKIEAARKEVAGILGVRAQEVIFTGGCTEANNLAIKGVMSLYPNGKVLVSAIEHDSVAEVAKECNHGFIPVDANGRVDLLQIERMLTDDVVLISVMYANNEIGAVQPLREVGRLVEVARKKRGSKGLPLFLHTDAAQASNYLNLKVDGLKVDMMSLNGGKMYGPKGSGCLFVGRSVELHPIFAGGGQERGLRSGTENVPAIIGFASALTRAQEMREIESERLAELRSLLYGGLEAAGGVVNGGIKDRLVNNINVRFAGVDNERLVFQLDELGYVVSSGSACHAKSSVASRTLQAIGLTEKEADSSIRISMGRGTTKEDVENIVKTIARLVAKNR